MKDDRLKFAHRDFDEVIDKLMVEDQEYVNEVLLNHREINLNRILILHHNHIHH